MPTQSSLFDYTLNRAFERGQKTLLGLADIYGNCVPETLKSWCTRKRTTIYGLGRTSAPSPKKRD
jgi:hypothetical protein